MRRGRWAMLLFLLPAAAVLAGEPAAPAASASPAPAASAAPAGGEVSFPLRPCALADIENLLAPEMFQRLGQAEGLAVRRGELEVAGVSCAVAVADTSGNGRFDDRDPTAFDLFVVRESGWTPAPALDPAAGLPARLGGQARLLADIMPRPWRAADGSWYRLAPAADGSAIAVGTRPLPAGQLRPVCAPAPAFLLLSGPEGAIAVAPDAATAVPAGDYRTALVVLGAGDLLAQGSFNPGAAPVAVAEGQVVDFPCGPPFAKTVTMIRRGGQFTLLLQVTGAEGAKYGVFLRGDQAAPPPAVRLLSAGGAVLAEGVFRYG